MVSQANDTGPLQGGSMTHIDRIEPSLPNRVYLLSPGDVHLGGHNRNQALYEILAAAECDTLVLNGDFLDVVSVEKLVKRLGASERELIRLIEEKRRAGTRVVYTFGNHDHSLPVLLAEVARLREGGVYREGTVEHEVLEVLALIENWQREEAFVHEHHGARFVHVHGDRWDSIVHGRIGWILEKIGSWAWELVKRLDREDDRIATFIKRRVKLWMKVSSHVADGAMALAREHGAHYAFAGHTHSPWESAADGVSYLNAGSFDLYESGIVSIGLEGQVQLHRVYARIHPTEKPALDASTA